MRCDGLVAEVQDWAASLEEVHARIAGAFARATEVATAQLNAHANPWVWGRSPPRPRLHRRRFTYLL